MEFKSITIKNFLSYYGENEIDFSDKTTIFIGQNNTGKSKIFDAINFALYERIWITDKGENGSWINNDDNEIASFILNDHMKNVAIESNVKSTETSVSLVMDNGEFFITAMRTYLYKLTEGKFDYSTKDFTVTELDKLSGNPRTYMGQEATDRLSIYFSPEIKDYFLFQGEASSKIMQLQKGGNFSRAVREIARLSVFEDAKDLAEQYTKHIRNIITRKKNKNKEQRAQQEELSRRIEEKEELRNSYNEKKDDADQKVSEYQAKLDDYEKKLASLKDFEDWFTRKKQVEENKRKTERELRDANSERMDIAEDAVFYKVLQKIKSFPEFYSKLEKKGEVPPSIPRLEIEKALKYCRCTICNTDLSEGTDARRFAESRLPKCDTDRLGSYLRDLNSTFGNAIDDVEQIPDRLKNLLEKKRRLEERRQSLLKQSVQIQTLLSQIELDSSHPEEKKKEADEIRKSFSQYTTFLERAKQDAAIQVGKITEVERELRQFRHELNSLIVEDEDIEDEDKIKNFYAEKINSAMNKLYTVAHDTAYNEVQKRADEYYKEMTKKNAALVGSIKIDTETSEIYTVDDQTGIRIRNINQGNRISIQLAVIAGILTVAQDQFGQQYPFITDAPVSALGGDNKISTIQTMIDAFEQSIIIIKDDTSSMNKTNDEIRQLIATSNDIGVAYELSLSKADNVLDQYTVVNKIKG